MLKNYIDSSKGHRILFEFIFYYNSLHQAGNKKRIQSSKYFGCTNALIYIVLYQAAMLSNKRSLAHRYERSYPFSFHSHYCIFREVHASNHASIFPWIILSCLFHSVLVYYPNWTNLIVLCFIFLDTVMYLISQWWYCR